MNIKKLLGAGIVAGAVAFSSIGAAAAAISIDADGKGFVGKGDVQYTFGGQNNAWLQANAENVRIRYNATVVTEQESNWTCDRDAGPQTQERSNETTTTTSLNAVTLTVARDKKHQVTGFNLNGYPSSVGGTPVVEQSGPAVGSCPNGWTAINLVVGNVRVVSSTGGLQVSADAGGTWRALLEAPAPVV
ncbi:MAG TPA: hypothetical protein VGV93_08020 [Acidimicrobiales bacterium]|nr:hypothetical protein [Acidimicrobiales bacterium]